MTAFLSSPQPIWSVTELNRAVKGLLERELPLLWVSGEISNLTVAASGHCYFSLKDAGAQVRCIMFRNRAQLLPFRPKEGLKVEARVTVSLYEARGDYQLNVESMRPAGLGALFEAFEKLKQKLALEGLFDGERKRSLPAAPKAIGIVTSPAAAALRDVLTTLARRAPHIPIVLYPTAVQGDGAAVTIAGMIAKAGERAEVDVLIVCRGGGSIEDLWAFNEEVVARAIAASPIPVVSGVGHETDFTIADFAADVRAPTPTAAAELTSPDRSAQIAAVQMLIGRWRRTMASRLQSSAQRLDYVARRLVHPGQRIVRQRQLLEAASQRMRLSVRRVLDKNGWALRGLSQRHAHYRPALAPMLARLTGLQYRLETAVQRGVMARTGALESAKGRLGALNPEAVLARGYSLVSTLDGRLVSDAASLKVGQAVKMTFAAGQAGAIVSEAPVEQGDLF